MGVLIKGMEMPKEGQIIVIDSTGQVWSNEWPTRGYMQIDGAKAVPVPPHGRLIDANELVIRITELVRKAKADGFGFGVDWYTAFIRHIEIAPTIIEAEE